MPACYDIHSHHSAHRPEDGVIQSVSVGSRPLLPPEGPFTAGIHPWHIDEEHMERQFETLQSLMHSPRLVGIGECGLDKRTATPLEIQKEFFIRQAAWADARGLPLIIHLVKAWPELIAIHKELNPRNAWIIHGFRGNATLAGQLIQQGFLLSFGLHFNAEAVRRAWPDALLAETDESGADIRTVYQLLADALSVTPQELADRLRAHVQKLFFI